MYFIRWIPFIAVCFCVCRWRPKTNSHVHPKYIWMENSGNGGVWIPTEYRYVLQEKKRGGKSGFSSFTMEKRLQKEAFPEGANLVSTHPISAQCALQLGKISQALQSAIWNHFTFVYFLGWASYRDCTQQQKYPHTYIIIFTIGWPLVALAPQTDLVL